MSKKITVTIDKDGVWAGDGVWTNDCRIEDCPAVLGWDQDSSDNTYEALADALAEHPWGGPVRITKSDGVYTAALVDD
jgi:hypothetical protein